MKLIWIFAGLLILAGCQFSPYVPYNSSYGYSDFQKSKTHYEVSYVGWENAPANEVKKYALLRACEIAFSNGFRFVTILDENSDSHLIREKKEGSFKEVREYDKIEKKWKTERTYEPGFEREKMVYTVNLSIKAGSTSTKESINVDDYLDQYYPQQK